MHTAHARSCCCSCCAGRIVRQQLLQAQLSCRARLPCLPAAAEPDFCTPNSRAIVTNDMPPTMLLRPRMTAE